MKQEYDVFLLLSGTYTDEQIKEVETNVKEVVEKAEGEIVFFDETIRRRLAYVIQKIRNGIYYKMRVNIEKESVDSLGKELRMINDIMRLSIVVARDYKKVEERVDDRDSEEKVVSEKKEETAEPKEEAKKEVAPEKVNEEELDKKIDGILEDAEVK
jgi:small subunit ribosomal protein S6